jgi:hypothetical protein
MSIARFWDKCTTQLFYGAADRDNFRESHNADRRSLGYTECSPQSIFRMQFKTKQQQASSLLFISCMLAFNSAMMTAKGPLTSGLKIVTALGGVGCCIAGIVIQTQAKKD